LVVQSIKNKENKIKIKKFNLEPRSFTKPTGKVMNPRFFLRVLFASRFKTEQLGKLCGIKLFENRNKTVYRG